MPVNSSRRLRDTAIWTKILEKLDSDGVFKIPSYIPGLLMFPDPEAGYIFGRIDFAFWAVFLYPLSALVYTIGSAFPVDPNYEDDYGDPNSTNAFVSLNLIGAAILFVDAFICIFDWYIQKYYGALVLINSRILYDNEDVELISELTNTSSAYYFFNNIFFLGAAIIYLIQAMWYEDYRIDLDNCMSRDWCGTFWVNFWGGTGYLISSLICLYEGIVEYRNRSKNDNPLCSKLFSLDYNLLNWWLWGDIFYVISSIMFVAQPFFYMFLDTENFYTERVDAIYYFCTNLVMFFDASLYQVGYHVYLFQIRDGVVEGFKRLTRANKAEMSVDGESLIYYIKDEFRESRGSITIFEKELMNSYNDTSNPMHGREKLTSNLIKNHFNEDASLDNLRDSMRNLISQSYLLSPSPRSSTASNNSLTSKNYEISTVNKDNNTCGIS